MTIEREEPGIVVAVCDSCGDRRMLDDEPFGQDDRAVAAQLVSAGWEQRAPERVRFSAAFDRGNIASYPQDFCGDCRDGEPGPAPRIIAKPPRPRGSTDAFANDPHDAWPRAAVWAAVGLREACGHPLGDKPHPCAHCEAGYPIGRTDVWWRR